MSGLFGIFHRDGSPVASATLQTMRQAMAHWGRDGSDIWLDGCAGLGQARTFSTPEAQYEHLPRFDSSRGITFTAAGRVDNRDELLANSRWQIADSQMPLAIRHQPSAIPDGDLLFHAYLKWGEDCAKHIYGDWAFAAWHPNERKLFLARDHYGNTALYYYADSRLFAFASERKALLALDLPSLEMDELYLAQVLISWPAYHGERTVYKSLRRLPPAHTLTVTPQHLNTQQYWRLEDTPLLHLPKRQDYVEAFREVFDEAVRVRLRVPSSPTSNLQSPISSVAVTLSGGLDSGSVTATAARLLQSTGKRLTAFTSVPLSDTNLYVGKNRFGDEFPFAQATAQFAGNVDLQPITASTITPMRAIRQALQIHGEPAHAAANFFWMHDLEETASAQGFRVLLTGQIGNASISWTGNVYSQSLPFQLRQKGLRMWTKERLKHLAPFEWMKTWRRLRYPKDLVRSSAIHPDFAGHLDLLEQRLNDSTESPHTPLEQRWQILIPGHSFLGALHAQMGAAYGLEIRDPTADARLLTFTLSVPDHIFIDPETGMDRWLIRAAMKDRLPDEVRLNRKRGRQAGDLVPRLRACAGEVETALDEIARGPAAAYVDVSYMRDVWQMIQTQDTQQAFTKSMTILTRGIMAGLWVNGFYGS
ncbi:MAG: asparagine synthetase B [Chloroflexi bacterium]|nr:asparagine synthetase B [Chloroflexota bacterium]